MADTGYRPYGVRWDRLPQATNIDDRRGRPIGTPEQHAAMQRAAERYWAGEINGAEYTNIVQPIREAFYHQQHPTAVGRAWDTATRNLDKGWTAIDDATRSWSTPLSRDAGIDDINIRQQEVPVDTATLSDGMNSAPSDYTGDYESGDFSREEYSSPYERSTQGYDEAGFEDESGAPSYDEAGFEEDEPGYEYTEDPQQYTNPVEQSSFDETGFQEELEASSYDESGFEDAEGYAEGGEVEEDEWETYVDPPQQYAQSAVGTGTMTDESPEQPAPKPADEWETYVEPPEEAPRVPSMSDTGDVWSGQEAPPPVQRASDNEWQDYVEPDTPLGAFSREVAKGLGPAAAGSVLGAGTGAALGAAGFNPVTVVGGTLIGGVAGGFGAEALQEKGLRAWGAQDDAAIRRANEEAHPWSTYGGKAISNIAGGAAGLGKAAITTGARVLGGGIGAAWEAGVQMYHGRPAKEALPAIASSAVGGAVFAGKRPWSQWGETQGAKIGARFAPAPPPAPAPPIQPAAPPPDQGQLPFGDTQAPPHLPKAGGPQQAQIGGGEAQPALPFGQPAQPGRPGVSRQPELPLEPPPTVDAQGQYGLTLNAPHHASRHSPDSTPAGAGSAKELPPPRETQWPAVPDSARPREPNARPHSAVGEGLAQEAAGVAPRTAAGIHVLQPGQMDPTIQAGLRQPTETLPVPPRTTFEPPRPPSRTPPAPVVEPLPRSRSLTHPNTRTTQGVTEPPVPGGHTRMYQGRGQPPREFSTDRAVAQRYGQVKYTDVKNDSMPFFKPGRQQGQYVTDNPNFRQRAQPVGQIQTQPPGGRKAAPAPDATSPAATSPPAGGAPPVPRMSTPEIDAAITRAVGPGAAAAPAAPARPAAPQARQAILTTKAGKRPVRVSPDPPRKGKDGREYQKVTYKGKDYFVPAEQLTMKPPPKTDAARREESFKILADIDARKKAGQGLPEHPAEPSADMSFIGREALAIAKKIEATGQPDAKSFVAGMRAAAHTNRVTPENMKFYEQRLAEYQARVGGDKPKEGYSARNMLEPAQNKKLDTLLKDRSTPAKNELATLLDRAVTRSQALAEEINAAGWRIRDINSGDVRIPPEIRAARANLTAIGGSLARTLNGIKLDSYTGKKTPKQIEARVKADVAMLRKDLASQKPETIPQPKREPAPPENVKYAEEQAARGKKEIAEHAADVTARATAPIDVKLANTLLNQPARLREEAAKRGVRPDELKAQAQEAVKPKPVETAQVKTLPKPGDDLEIPDFLKRAPKAEAPAAAAEKPLYPHAATPKPKLEAALAKARAEGTKLNEEMIAAGRGTEKPTETRGKTDDLSQRVNKSHELERSLQEEVKRRQRYHGKTTPIPEGSARDSFMAEGLIRPGATRGDPGARREGGPRRIGRRPEKLPIGTEQKILEKGYEKATGPKQEPRKPYMEGAERKGAKAKVKTHDDAVFTGATVHEAAVFARNAGYKAHQIFEMGGKPYSPPKAAASTTPAAAKAAPAVTGSSGGGGTPPGPKLTATPAPGTPQAPPGKIMEAVQAGSNKLFDIGHAVQMLATPMVRGTQTSMALAKDFANTLRRNRWEWSDIDTKIEKNHNPERRKAMWEAADAESVAQQQGKAAGSTPEWKALAPKERDTLNDLHERGKDAWERARALGMVEGEGLPAYTPRMLINLARGSSEGGPTNLDPIGLNLRTTTPQLKHRKHLTTAETEAAAKLKFGDKAEVVKDIRTLPLVIARLEDAIAGRTMVDDIKKIGKRTGTDVIAEGFKPTGSDHEWFTIDHPSLKTWRKSGDNFVQVPIYVRGDFEGPLRAVLTKPSGPLYNLMMDLKSKSMSVIMNSPMIHNAVEWGRALPAMPGKVLTFRVYFDGNRAKHDPAVMREAIDSGLVPIGKRFFNQDVHALLEEPNLTPGRSWTSQVVAFVPGLFSKELSNKTKLAIDKAGDFWHNTLLWDRIGDLQMGLYTNLRETIMAKGVDRQTASRTAAHLANRYAGAIPHEAMSDGARKLANGLMFSRSFTLGNIGAMKDMFNGMPKDVRAQIERDVGSLDPKAMAYIKSYARRKAVAIIGLDIALMYIGNSLLQSGLNVLKGDKTLDEEGRGYIERMNSMMKHVEENPWALLQPFHLMESLSSTSENEPGKQDRVRVGYTNDGQAIYLRNPAGKIGEEFVGWATSPLDMMRRKMSTMARPAWQIMSNDKGFGRKVYDPNADSVGKYTKNIAKIFEHIATAQTPEIQISGAKNLITGEGDPTLSKFQTFGPLVGVTASRGAPGGPAMGELYKGREKHQFSVNEALPEIRRLIKSEKEGDFDKAIDKMSDLGIPKALQKFYIRTTQDPSTRLTPKAAKDFYRYATPDEIKRFERAQEQQQRRQQ